MENLAANPSRKSRQQLFTWLTDRDMTIIGWTPPPLDEDTRLLTERVNALARQLNLLVAEHNATQQHPSTNRRLVGLQ